MQEAARSFLRMEKEKLSSRKNPIQKKLLAKNHEERYLQEMVDYASKRGDVSKIRLPTSETAAKIQNYQPIGTAEEMLEEMADLKLRDPEDYERMLKNTNSVPSEKKRLEKILSGETKGDIYESEEKVEDKETMKNELKDYLKKYMGKGGSFRFLIKAH